MNATPAATKKKPSKLKNEVDAAMHPDAPVIPEAILVNGQLHAPASLPPASHLQTIAVADLHPSPTNPRKTFTGIDELAKSIKNKGLIVPIIVRKRAAGGFEIIAGERRYRAAKKAELETVSCDVRELDDTQVFEVQILENSKREDLTELEQAEMYESLQLQHGYDVDMISKAFVISHGTVYARLKLLRLAPEARKAMADGVLPFSVAVPLARIPSHSHQVKALKEMKDRFIYDGEMAIAVRPAVEFLQKQFCRTLLRAPFKLTDPDLVFLETDKTGQRVCGGSCVGCPFNTATATPGLFEDFGAKPGQVCTNVACFDQKVDAAWKNTAAEAKAAGAEVLSREEGAKLFPYGDTLTHGSKYIELDIENAADRSKRTWREIYEKLPADKRPTLIVAPDRTLARRDLVDHSELLKAINDAPGAPAWAKAEEKVKAQKAKDREKAKESKAEEKTRERATLTALQKIGSKLKRLDEATLRFILVGLADRWIPQQVLDAAGIEHRDAYEKLLKRGDLAEMLNVLLMWGAYSGDVLEGDDGYSDEFKALARAHEVNVKDIEKAIEAGDEADKKAKS
jgi:ParB/RepB/Spo0J family partition protein